MKSVFRSVMNAMPAPMSMALDSFQQYVRYPDVRAARARRRDLFQRAGSPSTVQGGPFKGMRMRFELEQRNLLPILLGTYELELGSVVERVIGASPDAVINVGSAEGYFTIGMAIRLPSSRSVPFEIRKAARHQLSVNASLNQVGRSINQLGACTPELLAESLRPFSRPLVFCDCEGFEDVLLDPQKIPDLRKAIVLVEVHDGPGFAPGVRDRLIERFSTSHQIEIINERPRTIADCPIGCDLSESEFLEAINEERSLVGLWYHMTPRSARIS